MGRFHFRLQRLLRVRQVEEQVARTRWLAALGQARHAEGRADELATTRGAANVELGEELGRGSLAPESVLASHHALDAIDTALVRARERVHTLRLQAEQAREPWRGRRDAVRGLERLRERQQVRHRTDQERAAARDMDEVALVRALAERRISRPRTTSPVPDEDQR